MTKQEKFLLLVVLVVSGVGATIYVQNTKATSAVKEQVQVSVQNQGSIQTAQDVRPSTDTPAQPINTNTTTNPTVIAQNTNNTNTVRPVPSNTSSTKQATVSYRVPSGDTEDLGVTVTLVNNVISDISFSMSPTNRQSVEYYNNFKNSFPKSQVVGKSLDNVSLSRVGGASLTTNAFNRAISGLRG